MELGASNHPDDLDAYLGASGYAGPWDLELSSLAWRLPPQPDRRQKSKTWVRDGKSRVKDLNKQQLWNTGQMS